MKLLDSSAWVEYFKGSEKGLKVKELLQERTATSAISLAELAFWFEKEGQDFIPALKNIQKNNVIISVEEEILISSGKLCFRLRKIRNKIGIIDCIIYSTAVTHGLTLVSTDSDFQGLPSVEIL